MKIMVSGVPAAMLDTAEAEIRAALSLHPDAGDLEVVATKRPEGGWVAYVFDAQTGAEITELRVLARRLTAIGNESPRTP
jgi:hypothetical protein